MCFQSIVYQKTIVLFCNDICLYEKTLNFITVFTAFHWAKQAQPATQISLTSILLMGGLANDAGEAGWVKLYAWLAACCFFLLESHHIHYDFIERV